MRSLLRLIFFLPSLAFAFTADDGAKTISTDGSYSDTTNGLAYVADKAQDGWVMTVGSAGQACNWSNQCNVSIAYTFTFQGASADNRPTIKFWDSSLIGINVGANPNKIVTVKDFIIEDSATGPTFRKIYVGGSGVCFRISNIKFNSLIVCAPLIGIGSINGTHLTGPYGLIDHCEWNFSSGCQMNGIFIIDNGSTDHWGWTQPMTWGTTNCVVVEDCIFTTDHAPAGTVIDSYGGGRMVLRYSNITNFYFSTHGRQSGANDSSLQHELYKCNFHVNDTMNGMGFMAWARGGSWLIWSNTVTQSQLQLLSGGSWRFSVECAASFWASEGCAAQLIYPADYPAIQQVGRGVVAGAEGSVPMYVWGNTVPAQNAGGPIWGEIQRYSDGTVEPPTGDAPFIIPDREYFTVAMPGYTPLAYPYSIGTNGGGVGANHKQLPFRKRS